MCSKSMLAERLRLQIKGIKCITNQYQLKDLGYKLKALEAKQSKQSKLKQNLQDVLLQVISKLSAL